MQAQSACASPKSPSMHEQFANESLYALRKEAKVDLWKWVDAERLKKDQKYMREHPVLTSAVRSF